MLKRCNWEKHFVANWTYSVVDVVLIRVASGIKTKFDFFISSKNITVS